MHACKCVSTCTWLCMYIQTAYTLCVCVCACECMHASHAALGIKFKRGQPLTEEGSLVREDCLARS